MANTPNLDLEEISLDDNVKTTFINKLNNNQNKIDTKYGYLVDNLLENTKKDTLVEAIEEVNNLVVTISNLEEEVDSLNNTIDSLNNIGDAEASEIKSGKKALVQGVEVTGTLLSQSITATASDIKTGKTAYDQNGSIITGTLIPKNCEVAAVVINGSLTTSVTFNFSKDITNARIFYIAKPSTSGMGVAYSTSSFYLDSYDSNDGNKWYCSYSNGRSYYSYKYIITSYYSMTKNGNSVTFSSSNSSYSIGSYDSYATNGICIAIWE